MTDLTTKYYVSYRNQGKSERTPVFDTKERAEEAKRMLKFQGATAIRLHKVGD